jgi:hypothetical protein
MTTAASFAVDIVLFLLVNNLIESHCHYIRTPSLELLVTK